MFKCEYIVKRSFFYYKKPGIFKNLTEDEVYEHSWDMGIIDYKTKSNLVELFFINFLSKIPKNFKLTINSINFCESLLFLSAFS